MLYSRTLFIHFICNRLHLGEGNGTPLQYSCLENPMDGGAWWAAVHGVTKSWTDWATSFSLFTVMHWRRKWQPTPVFLPGESQGRGELGGLPSVGLHRVGHDWSDLAAAASCICSSQTLNLFLPHPCSTLLTTSLLSMPVFHRSVHLCYIVDSTYEWHHMLFVFLWLT